MKLYSTFGQIISIIAIGRYDDCYITGEYHANLIGSDDVNIHSAYSMRHPLRYPSCFEVNIYCCFVFIETLSLPSPHHRPDRHCCRRTQCSPCSCWRPARPLRPRLCTSGVPVEWLTWCPPPEPLVLGAAVGFGRLLSQAARPLTDLPAHSAKVRPWGGKTEQRTHLFAENCCS